MFAKRLSRLFLIILAGTLATTGKHFAEENKSPQRKPLRPFLLALPPSATPDSTNPDLRASALRMLIYQGKTAEAIARLSSEKDPSVFLATLATIGAFGDANDASARAFIIEQCNSENEIIASTAVSILPRLNINDPKIYQAALQHKSNNIRVWAIRSIGDSTIAASFSPEIENSIKDTDSNISFAATLAWFKITAKKSPGTNTAVLNEAEKLLAQNPALAPAVINALLSLEIQPSPSLSTKLLSLPVEQRRSVFRVFSYFPNQFDSDFLRKATTGDDSESTQMALSMLASKTSPKNDATLGLLSQILSTGNINLISTILNSFDSDTEFALLGRTSSDSSSDTPEVRNDSFTGPGNTPGSIIGAQASASTQRTKSRNIGRASEDMPSMREITRFFGILAQIANNKTLTSALQNRATLLSLDQSNSPKLLDAVHRMLSNDRIPTIQTGVNICARRYNDLRYIGLVLKFITSSENLPPSAFIANPDILAPYFNLDDPGATQMFGHFGRLLLVEKNPQKNLLGFALLATHGTPANASYVLPLCESSDPVTRRAAYHCLSRLAPEIYALRLETIAKDTAPGVRETIPLAFFKTGYRWEHPLANDKTCAQWITPKIFVTPDEQSLKILNSLTSDNNPTIRLNARLALLQHGKLSDPESVLNDADGTGGAFFTARLIQAVRASGKETPVELAAYIPPVVASANPSAPKRTLAVFINPNSRQRITLEGHIDALRQTIPDIDVQIYYGNEETAIKKSNRLYRMFPVSTKQGIGNNLAISSGAWISGDTIDFSALVELLDHADNTDSSLLDKILNAPENNQVQASIKPLSLVTLSTVGVIAIFALLMAGIIVRRRHA